ncbi:MAG TPA: VOC family protein [Lacunisphaera sp.]|nr:VOC family protein [Lacunisphaera sp.]
MPNPVIRWQIVSPEPNKASRFYEKLFAWKLSTANGLGYRELVNGTGRGVDGGVWPAPPDKPGLVQLVIEVEDVDETLLAAVKLGAQVIVPKSVLPDGDTMAVLLDPTGLSFILCQLRSRS